MLLFRVKYYIFFLTFTSIFTGCGLWQNFTTFFNLYYNTSDIFQQAELQIKEQEKDLFSSEEINLPGTVNSQLIKVIEKCSEILQFHYESDYVDDALLMLGKSFYYQKNYQKALRKFDELLATQEESDLILETRLWVAKTEMKLKNYETALTILDEVRNKAIEEEEEEILKDAFIVEIIYRIVQEDYRSAIALANQLTEVSDDETIKAEVHLELGRLYNLVEEPWNAITSFEKVFDFSPVYEIELDTKLELGKTLRVVGENERALEIFSDMKDEAKFSESYNLIDLEIGLTLYELKRLDEAVDKLVFVDTSYVNTSSSGYAKYKLGEIYEYDYKNFDSAASYYQKSISSSLPKDLVITVNQKIRVFKKYQQLTSLIKNNKDQLFYIENPEEYTKDSLTFVQDSIDYVRDSLAVLEELNLYSEHLETLSAFDTLTADDTSAVSLSDLTLNADSVLFDPINIIETQRRLVFKNIETNQRIDYGGINIDSLFAEKWDVERRFPKKPIKPALSEDTLKSLVARDEIELGNLFLTEMELLDSAYHYYNDVITNYPNTDRQATALYALGSYYLNVDEREKADSLFNVIYENYRDESIVNAAANKLNKPLIDFEYDPAKDLYLEAENELLRENYTASVDKFYRIYREYPASSIAPKALFASGWVLENELKMNDSAAVVYDTMAVHYPQSEFTVKISPKLTAYKQYQKEIEDSLKRIEEGLIAEDSLSIDSDSLQTDTSLEEAFHPKDEDEVNKEQEKKLPADTSRKVILDDPRRNPRKR